MRERQNVCERQSVINVTYELILTCKVSRCLHELGISENICIMVMRAFKENAQPYSKSRMFMHMLKAQNTMESESLRICNCPASNVPHRR